MFPRAMGFWLSLLIPFTAAAKGPEIFPLDQVKTGQKGYGLTVFQGTKPERFEFEVVGILRKALPKQDLIVVRSSDPKIKEVGFARGMSGSPLYLEDKVACAFSYGFPFSRGDIGACTPIEYMISDLKRPRVFADANAGHASPNFAPNFASVDELLSALPKQTAPDADAPDSLVPATLPLLITGLSPAAFDQAKKIFEPFGITPTLAAGGGGGGNAPDKFEMGGAIGAMLARGDVSMVAVGTVSYVDGDSVLAFGHPMFGMGELHVPTTTADVLTVVPSVNMAFKLASPRNVLGSLVQDRQTSIAIDTRLTTEMIPVDIIVKLPFGSERFHSEILRHRFLTPALVGVMLQSATQLIAPAMSDVTVTIDSTLVLHGFEPLHFTDTVYAPDGSMGAINGTRALRVLSPLLFNSFEPVAVDKFSMTVDVAFKADVAAIESIRVPDYELPAGEPTYVDVVLRPYGGRSTVQRIPLTIPERLAGSTIKLEIQPGDQVKPDVAPPNSLADLLSSLKDLLPGNSLVATLYTPDDGVTLAGKVISNLPDSALDTARPATSTRRGEAYRSIVRVVAPADRVVQGKQELVLRIKDKR